MSFSKLKGAFSLLLKIFPNQLIRLLFPFPYNLEGGKGYLPLSYKGIYENLVELQKSRNLLFL